MEVELSKEEVVALRMFVKPHLSENLWLTPKTACELYLKLNAITEEFDDD